MALFQLQIKAGMGCQVLRILNQRSVKKAIFLGTVVVTFHITSILYNLVGSNTPFFENHEHDIPHFHQLWCRMQGWRVDWETVVKPCAGKVAWDERKVNSKWRTDANNSFITKWEIQPAGHFSRFFIQSVTRDGVHKNFGGDAWRVYIREGPASLAPQVWDHHNGMYEVVFLVMEPGDYSAQITLDFTLCDGLRDPPVDWFIKGTVQGKYQPDGILGYIGDDYILEPIGGKTAINFFVPENWNNTQEFVPGKACGITCNPLQNGFGRWVDGLWRPYTEDNSTAAVENSSFTGADTLWIYGDSVSKRFLESLRLRGICKKFFKKCKNSYIWTYEVTNRNEARGKFSPNDFNKTVILQYLTNILDSPDMRGQNSVFVFNLGIHYSMSLNFTTYRDLVDSVIMLLRRKVHVQNNNKPIVIWKTTTFIEKEKTHPKNSTNLRFDTRERLELFHKYTTNAMCKVGIPVLDTYQMTASYPDGTLDHVHYNANAQRAAEDQLLAFIMQEMKKTSS